MNPIPLLALVAAMLVASCPLAATETENLGLRILPASAAMAIDGNTADWDLSGGIFACDNVEVRRERLAVWLHAMYDAKNLYLLARFIDDTPMNNPGQTGGDPGFAGDSLQVRFLFARDTPDERTSHWTCWRGSDGKDIMDVVYARFGKNINEGAIKDAKASGAAQAFAKEAHGYAQELAIPWALLSRDGKAPGAGGAFAMAVEPNFTIGVGGRLTVKDIFKAGLPNIDRVFTFMNEAVWGDATLEKTGQVAPRALHLADGREFAVHLVGGAPVVDWTGLVRNVESPGVKSIDLTMPSDGYASLQVVAKDGTVVRQLLNQAFFSKGLHHVPWDGLATGWWRTPGEPVPAGDYTVRGIAHAGIGLALRGFAGNAGTVPWDNGPGSNWGGDHGVPSSIACDAQHLYLGWTSAEAGKALVACDHDGVPQWSNIHGGIAGAKLVATDGHLVYVLRDAERPSAGKMVVLYRLDAANGRYAPWEGTDSPDLEVEFPDGLAVANHRLYLTHASTDRIELRDAATGKGVASWPVPRPRDLRIGSDGRGYVLSGAAGPHGSGAQSSDQAGGGATTVLAIDLASGATTAVVQGLVNATALAVSPDGTLYVGEGAPSHQIRVFDAAGHERPGIGRPAGRPVTGPWIADGLRDITALAVDARNRLWVAESCAHPKRISAWDVATRKPVKELFGACHYGAGGATIDPLDPDIMVGEGCEWRIDHATGLGRCTGVIADTFHGATRFITGPKGRTYLVTSTASGPPLYQVFERVAEGDYRLRGEIAGDAGGATAFWSDANGDGQRQAQETSSMPGTISASPYIGIGLDVADDLTVFATRRLNGATTAVQLPLAGWTPNGAPQWHVESLRPVVAPGFPSPDGKRLMTSSVEARTFTAYDLATGAVCWNYPNTFGGVHGSHDAPGIEQGLIRGALAVVGCVRLPEPVGYAWVVTTNVGEWHLLTRDGFYLTQLFQGDTFKVALPERAVPGADMTNAPPGLGGEDFGGSAISGADGEVYVQAGKTALWNLKVTGLKTITALPVATVSLTSADVRRAQGLREQQLQIASGLRRLAVTHATPTFSGNLEHDFTAADLVKFKKTDDAAIRAALAWDADRLYVGFEVADATPWINGAGEAAMMYLGGDTVDVQIGTDAAADAQRSEPVLGDLRLSIGSVKGEPKAVIYRKVAKDRHPRTFSSGVVAAYVLDSVVEVSGADIRLTRNGNGYVIEAAIPLTALGLSPTSGATMRGDVGVTHGDPGGTRTRLRSYWSNQHTGLVDDAVFELQMEPAHWGELVFR
ncbi:MAG: hypothetical protein H0X38_01135 [Planctomycetes bacterium]|nr:hypothetical protein [Planctomycetota bacterium]